MLVDKFKYRNKKILAHARGQECQMRLPGICNRNPETVVAAHSNAMADGKGKGTKSGDHMVCFACSNCHAAYDGAQKVSYMDWDVIEEWFYRGMRRTWTILLRDGILK